MASISGRSAAGYSSADGSAHWPKCVSRSIRMAGKLMVARPRRCRVQLGRRVGPLAELRGEVELDVREVVAHDAAGLTVPEHRDGNVAVVARLRRLVGLAQQREAVHRIQRVTIALAEGPAPAVADRIHRRQGDDVLEPEQLADDRRAVSPGARPRDVQVVTTGLSRVSAGTVGRDPAAERIRRPDELRSRPRLLTVPRLPEVAVVAEHVEIYRAGAAQPFAVRRHLSSLPCWAPHAQLSRSGLPTPLPPGAAFPVLAGTDTRLFVSPNFLQSHKADIEVGSRALW